MRFLSKIVQGISLALYEFYKNQLLRPCLEINFVSIVPETLGSSDFHRNVSHENFRLAKFLIVLSNLHERKRRE